MKGDLVVPGLQAEKPLSQDSRLQPTDGESLTVAQPRDGSVSQGTVTTTVAPVRTIATRGVGCHSASRGPRDGAALESATTPRTGSAGAWP